MATANLEYTDTLTKMACKQNFLDLDWAKEFWGRIKGIPNKTLYEYTKDGTTYATTNIVNAIADLYSKNASAVLDIVGSNYIEAKDGTGEKAGTVTLTLQKTAASVTDSTETDDIVLVSALTGYAAEKNSTTLTGSENLDLSQGDVTITLSGDVVSEGSNSIVLKGLKAKSDQELSTDKTSTVGYSGTQTIYLSGVIGKVSSADVYMPAAQTISSTGDSYAAFGSANQKITISDATSDNTVSIAIPKLTAAKGESSSSYVSVELTNGVLSVKDTIEDTFLKKADAHNDLISIDDVKLEKVEGSTTYSGKMSYTDNAGDGKTATISFDSADFIKDAFLDTVTVGEGEDAGYLIFTWNTDAGKEATKIKIADFIKAYTKGDGIVITDDNVISVKAKEGGYISVTSDGVDILDSQIQTGSATGASTLLATKGYVDEQAAAKTVTVTKTDVSAFGSTGSIEIEQNGTSVDTFTVELPSFTTGKSTSENVSVAIADDGTISVTTKEQSATDTTTYKNTALATAAYVDELVAANACDCAAISWEDSEVDTNFAY